MLYSSDLNDLLFQWQEVSKRHSADQSYKDAVRDCIYDLKSLIDKSFEEEILANEAFEQQLKEDEAYWNEFLDHKYEREGIVAS